MAISLLLRLDSENFPHINYDDGNNSDLKYARLISPTLYINHAFGKPDSYFTVIGSEFLSGREMNISVNGYFLSNLTSDDNGGFTFLLNTGDADLGYYHVLVSMNPSLIVSFTLDPDAPLRSQDGEVRSLMFHLASHLNIDNYSHSSLEILLISTDSSQFGSEASKLPAFVWAGSVHGASYSPIQQWSGDAFSVATLS